MGFKVILTPQSVDDLEEIVAFIAKDTPSLARTFGNELIDRALSTARFPERNRVVPEIGESAVREIIHRAYRIVQEVSRDEQTVYVLRFWHSARGDLKIESKLRPGSRQSQAPENASRRGLVMPLGRSSFRAHKICR